MSDSNKSLLDLDFSNEGELFSKSKHSAHTAPANRSVSPIGGIKSTVKNNKITVVNVTVSIFLVAIVISVLLLLGRNLNMQIAEESTVNFTGTVARDAQAYFVAKIDVARNVAHMVAGYENIEAELRRAFVMNTLQDGLASHSGVRDIFVIWRPNELDGLDHFYANTVNRDETGQFIAGFTRERGWMEPKLFTDYRFLPDLHFEDYFAFGVERISEPRPAFVVNPLGDWRGDDVRDFTWVVDIWVPLLSEASRIGAADVKAVVGATIYLERLQLVSETIKPHGTGRVLVCSNTGVVIAHPDVEPRGINILDPGNNETAFSDEDYYRLRRNISNSMASLTPSSFRTADDLIITYPLNTTTTIQSRSTHGVMTSPPWVLVAIVPLATIMAPIYQMFYFSILLIIGAGLVMGFVLFVTSRSLTQQARHLQQNLEQASTMQDNLKYGLFLINESYIIQGAYSKALERILSIEDLKGKSIIEVFSGSLKDSEQRGFADYLDMIFTSSFEKEMLESINPVHEFTYFNNETQEEKSLRTTFTLAGLGRDEKFILGTMEDITAERELEKQLKEAESQRENEMRSLFQVIQLDPRVLSDFVADAEYEFERINEALKNKKYLQQDVLVEMYQSIHAIKSNALVLNLESFSERLHKLEGTIKLLQDDKKKAIPFDDFLGLILELNDAMREIDQLQAAVLKIENFKNVAGRDKNQERYVLVETLSRVCNKTQVALGKKVKFIVEEIDEIALDYGPRRAIKEILTQLTRNAVYHGIESPEERIPLGKAPEGEIRLSITCMENLITIKLTDNGAGIDFSRIQKSADTFNLPISPNKANDKKFLLNTIFIPGFTTLGGADFHAGRGIGLSLVKDRVKSLNGNIKVTTAAGKGTTFTISLPMELPAADHAS